MSGKIWQSSGLKLGTYRPNEALNFGEDIVAEAGALGPAHFEA